MAPDTQKSLLGYVFCLCLTHAKATQKSEKLSLVQVNQLRKCKLFACGDATQDGLNSQKLTSEYLAQPCKVQTIAG